MNKIMLITAPWSPIQNGSKCASWIIKWSSNKGDIFYKYCLLPNCCQSKVDFTYICLKQKQIWHQEISLHTPVSIWSELLDRCMGLLSSSLLEYIKRANTQNKSANKFYSWYQKALLNYMSIAKDISRASTSENIVGRLRLYIVDGVGCVITTVSIQEKLTVLSSLLTLECLFKIFTFSNVVRSRLLPVYQLLKIPVYLCIN